MATKKRKIGLIGGGQIGGNLALLAVQKGLGEVVLYDIAPAEGLVKGKALDINQLAAVDGLDCRVTGTTDWKDVAGSDVVIITAGVPRKPGFFHADMHPGNLFLDPSGRLVAVDFGIMGRLGMKERRFLAEILLGFITRDYRRVAEVHFEAGYVPGHHSVENFAQAIRAIGEPIHNRTAEEISMAKLLTLLLEVTGLFDMQTRPELILLQKTMVVVEGVARSFDPKLDIWKVADPVVREWIERNLGPLGKIQGAMSGAGELGRVVAALPSIATRAVTVLEQLETMSREGLKLDSETVAAIARSQARQLRWRTVGVWIIALTLLEVLWSMH